MSVAVPDGRRPDTPRFTLCDLALCFEGVIPAVIATTSADGTPNVTYLSQVRMLDDERVALSNQFFSKTARNLAEVPRASVLVIDPSNYDEFRLTLVYERTERRGEVFERLRADVDTIAAISGMQDVFKLRAADIYRVVDIEQIPSAASLRGHRADVAAAALDRPESLASLSELAGRLARCGDLDTVVAATVSGLDGVLGYEHSLLLLLDESGRHLYTIASHGYPAEGVGSEVPVGEGVIGMAASRCSPVRIGNARQIAKYGRRVRRSFEGQGEIGPGREIPVPGLADADSQVAVPLMAMGQLIGVLLVESPQPVAFGESDEAVLAVLGGLVASAVEAHRAQGAEPDAGPQAAGTLVSAPASPGSSTQVRFFSIDGSTFLDGDYLIKGVAGRILWALLGQYQRERRVDFTNREVRLDPSLELPELRDNFESRLILLKRRLDERGAPIRIDKTGRGRFRLRVDGAVELDLVTTTEA